MEEYGTLKTSLPAACLVIAYRLRLFEGFILLQILRNLTSDQSTLDYHPITGRLTNRHLCANCDWCRHREDTLRLESTPLQLGWCNGLYWILENFLTY